MISIKTNGEIKLMRKAGEIVGHVLYDIEKFIKPGITTKQLDAKAENLIKDLGGIPAFKGYKGFPGNICTSINSIVVHGIPKDEVLQDGDIISIDVGVMCDGYYADAASTFRVGTISKAAQRLMKVTSDSLYKGIENAVPNKRLGDISHAIQAFVEPQGYGVVRALVGHGIGSEIHEDPEIPNFGEPNKGVLLKPGMTLAIEPMVNEGTYDIEILEDGWTVAAKDGSLSAHFEHTILITKDKPEILTQWPKKKQ